MFFYTQTAHREKYEQLQSAWLQSIRRTIEYPTTEYTTTEHTTTEYSTSEYITKEYTITECTATQSTTTESTTKEWVRQGRWTTWSRLWAGRCSGWQQPQTGCGRRRRINYDLQDSRHPVSCSRAPPGPRVGDSHHLKAGSFPHRTSTTLPAIVESLAHYLKKLNVFNKHLSQEMTS